jgi:NCAIR mutase (PurE)-related protein
MLNSCSPGVAVVNIDNGYGAGYLAAEIAAPQSAEPAGQMPGPTGQ